MEGRSMRYIIFLTITLILTACSNKRTYVSPCGKEPGHENAEAWEKWKQCEAKIVTGIEQKHEPKE
jgi:hypothetical protein